MCIPWSGIASSYNDDSIGTEISKIAFLKLMRFALELLICQGMDILFYLSIYENKVLGNIC